ncbi:MAG TPA: hypothetical protein VJB06_00640 [archaeon]|nr:hypothetical protein [archaeon]
MMRKDKVVDRKELYGVLDDVLKLNVPSYLRSKETLTLIPARMKFVKAGNESERNGPYNGRMEVETCGLYLCKDGLEMGNSCHFIGGGLFTETGWRIDSCQVIKKDDRYVALLPEGKTELCEAGREFDGFSGIRETLAGSIRKLRAKRDLGNILTPAYCVTEDD